MADVIINLEVIDQAAINLVPTAEVPIALEVVEYTGAGPQGLSAYQISILNGTFVGSELEWAQSLAKISVGPVAPPNPVVNQLWADTNP